MPGFHALGQHRALVDLHGQLRSAEDLYAFVDDVYITTHPERTVAALQAAQASLPRHANVHIHRGKTKVWNSAGEEPPGLAVALPVADDEPPPGLGTGHWQPSKASSS